MARASTLVETTASLGSRTTPCPAPLEPVSAPTAASTTPSQPATRVGTVMPAESVSRTTAPRRGTLCSPAVAYPEIPGWMVSPSPDFGSYSEKHSRRPRDQAVPVSADLRRTRRLPFDVHRRSVERARRPRKLCSGAAMRARSRHRHRTRLDRPDDHTPALFTTVPTICSQQRRVGDTSRTTRPERTDASTRGHSCTGAPPTVERFEACRDGLRAIPSLQHESIGSPPWPAPPLLGRHRPQDRPRRPQTRRCRPLGSRRREAPERRPSERGGPSRGPWQSQQRQ